ncbi:hypothetical protein SAMN04488047_10175 [Tranquillimonas alkanivorans]|uniref:DUF7946 domain-containing protein n=1 Tax=Tranquillimonas alkanivorans TaxID=441119 RepID=A0A1I5KGH0_9RHOB|nr:hypothetical protein SAMN04488047_10175 [Tranquillimonas alkanivorans]
MIEDRSSLKVELKYSGDQADQHLISLYDLSQALYGFERSLALTTHLVLNDEVITQATALRGAEILCFAPRAGSVSIVAAIGLLATGAYKLTTLKADNPLGHLIHSAYDFAVHKVTGQPLDYDKSMRQLYEEGRYEKALGLKLPRESQFDSLAEKIEPPLTKMHRPIVRSQTAGAAEIFFSSELSAKPRVINFNRDTYAKMKYRTRLDQIHPVEAKVAVFNPNTQNGRIFVSEHERTIPFYLTPAGRSTEAYRLIGESYSKNLNNREDDNAFLVFDVLEVKSKLGRTTKYQVVKVRPRESADAEFDLIENF